MNLSPKIFESEENLLLELYQPLIDYFYLLESTTQSSAKMTLPKVLFILPFFALLLSFLTNGTLDSFSDPRDGEVYQTVPLNGLNWFKENLRYRSESKSDTLITLGQCGVFYPFEEVKTACPEGWRLPTEKEVKDLIKADKKGRIHLADTLAIELCGRIDYEKHAKHGDQNTFWLNEELVDGHVTHWHTFKNKHELHAHDVENARRKFPVRCVCELN